MLELFDAMSELFDAMSKLFDALFNYLYRCFYITDSLRNQKVQVNSKDKLRSENRIESMYESI